jgi:hypothetical protein
MDETTAALALVRGVTVSWYLPSGLDPLGAAKTSRTLAA